MFNFSDGLFKKIENKTNVSKDTILNLAAKLQESDLKNEGTIRELIKDISNITGKEVSKEKEDSIVNAIINDKIPKDLDKFV